MAVGLGVGVFRSVAVAPGFGVFFAVALGVVFLVGLADWAEALRRTVDRIVGAAVGSSVAKAGLGRASSE